jgi:glutamate dehydrogenase/leucine dehydrogenase
MLELLNKYKDKTPEIVFEWNDSLSDAKGWIVINSLKNGAAGGGTRMRKGLTKDEVISLAKVMEIKFSVSGPAIGGAKSGIDFDPNDPRKEEVLKRWYKAVLPLLKHYYGTGGDLNVDELKDVIPITEDLGLWHPQEGIVNGHFNMKDGAKINIIGQLRYGCSKIVEDSNYIPNINKKYAVADLITGYGVSESVRHYYDIFKNKDITGKKVIIQGWGNVASAAGYYLSRNGAKIVGIIDRAGGVINEDGFSMEEVEEMFVKKQDNKLIAENMMMFEEINDKIWKINADIFIPGAASKIVNRIQMDNLIDKGLELMSCGANVPFVDDNIFFGPTASYVDSKISIIPDFIANCGMARVFAYLMQQDVPMTDKDIFEDVSTTIKKAILKLNISNESKSTYLCNKGIEIALNDLKINEV